MAAAKRTKNRKKANRSLRVRTRFKVLAHLYEATLREDLKSRCAVRAALLRFASQRRFNRSVALSVLSTYRGQGYLEADAKKNKSDDEAKWEKRRARRTRAEAVQRRTRAEAVRRRDQSSYRPISSNEFVIGKPQTFEADVDVCSKPCDCTADLCVCNCTETLCSPRCGCEGTCANSFANPCRVIVREVERGSVGSGVLAGERIDPGAFIAEYVGQYVRRDKSATYAYGVAVADDLVINALAAGNDMRFVNHSCRPNAELKKKHDPETGLERVGLYARNRIARDEEITFAYCPKPDLWFACKCGACVDSK